MSHEAAAFVWGTLGGLLAEAIAVRSLYENDKRRWAVERKRPAFWVFTVLFPVAGGVTALAHAGTSSMMTTWLALNVGFTWPLLLRRGAGAISVSPYEDVS